MDAISRNGLNVQSLTKSQDDGMKQPCSGLGTGQPSWKWTRAMVARFLTNQRRL